MKNFVRDEEDNESGEEDQIAKKIRLQHLHDTIRRILRVTPLGCGILLNILIELFPQRSRDVRLQTEFARESLRVGEYVPVLRDKLLGIIIERLLDLDVSLAIEMESQQRLLEENGILNFQDYKKLKISREESEIAEKIDAILCVLFDYFDECIEKKRSSAALFKCTLDYFDKLILRTNRAKFVQFFMFYICKSKTSFVDAFLKLLLDRVTDEKEDILVRNSAANYLGSFVARANFVRFESLKSILKQAVDWLILKQQKFSSTPLRIFDALFQAIIYILIFKGPRFNGLSYMKTVDGWNDLNKTLDRVPLYLKEEYLAYIAKENSGTLDKNIVNESDDDKMAHLLLEFPFDPLDSSMLENAAKKIEPIYQTWKNVDSIEGPNDEIVDDENEVEEEDLVSKDLLNKTIPNPIKIEKIRKLLGMEDNIVFPSPNLKPIMKDKDIKNEPRQRGFSTLSVDSRGSW